MGFDRCMTGGGVPPGDCSHEGACWSSCCVLHCPRCGVCLFLPPRLLARLEPAVIMVMRRCWLDAGGPHYGRRGWATGGAWPVQDQVLFEQLGGIPVAPHRLEKWRGAWGAISGTAMS